MKRRLWRLGVSLVVTIALLAVLETGACIYVTRIAGEEARLDYASLRQLQELDSAGALFRPHRYLGYTLAPNYRKGPNRHNALGYRGDEIEIPKPPGRFRIVCLGGSTTYTGKVNDYKGSYPDLLGEVLRARGHGSVEVINAGVSGWSSYETLINFELRVLDLEPDLAIVYHGINDIHARFVWPPEAYRGDNSGYRSPASLRFMPSILEYSNLWRILAVRAGWMVPHAKLEATTDPELETYHGTEFLRQVREGRYPQGIFEEVSAQRMLETNAPRWFERNIRNLIALARGREIPVALSSFAYAPSFRSYPRASSLEYITAFGESNRLLEEIARGEGAAFFDFASAFGQERRFFEDGRHVTAAGARRKAELFADFLEASGLLP